MESLPLLVHIVFHPASLEARALAERIHRALNADSVVHGLRIPTTYLPEDAGGVPPADLNWGDAQRNFVVVLADATMSVEPQWCALVGDVSDRCASGLGRMFPVQLGTNSYPLDNRLAGTNFVRAWSVKEPARTALIGRRLVIELCRYLHGDEAGGDKAQAPTRVFVSHTKIDLDVDPPVVAAIVDALRIDQPVTGWFDTGDIDAGSTFARETEDGVADASLLCVLTDNYASREWCRREVLLGKKHRRPILVLDALSGFEVRSFPYLGNLPVMRWAGDAEAVIDCLLKETLRHLHVTKVLEQYQEDGDVVFTRPPELVTIAGIGRENTVLYPDPPLGQEEVQLLSATVPRMTTPLLRMTESEGYLTGKLIAMSMSESSDVHRFGLSHLHQREFMLELSRYLLIQGATLAYGGHLGDEGYTAALAELVRAHNSVPGVDPVERIINYVGWPAPWNVDIRDEYKPTAELIRVDRPEDVPDIDVTEPGGFTADRRYAWARGMTAMRNAMAGNADIRARIVLGGKAAETTIVGPDGQPQKHWYSGRIPGVLEEVVTSVEAGQPVFLIASFGGVAGLVMDIIDGVDRPEMTWQYQREAPWSDELRQQYESAGLHWYGYREITGYLSDKGLTGINPLLPDDEHRGLATARQLPTVIGTLLSGLARLD